MRLCETELLVWPVSTWRIEQGNHTHKAIRWYFEYLFWWLVFGCTSTIFYHWCTLLSVLLVQSFSYASLPDSRLLGTGWMFESKPGSGTLCVPQVDQLGIVGPTGESHVAMVHGLRLVIRVEVYHFVRIFCGDMLSLPKDPLRVSWCSNYLCQLLGRCPC